MKLVHYPVWDPHLFEFLPPGLLSLAEAVVSLFSLFEAADHLFVVRVSLPVLQLLVVFSHQRWLHVHVELAHLLRLRAQSRPRPLQRTILRAWGKSYSPSVSRHYYYFILLSQRKHTITGTFFIYWIAILFDANSFTQFHVKLELNINIPTFVYELAPALSPFWELLCVGLLNTCSLMNTGHQIIAEPAAIVYPFHWALVVTNLTNSNLVKRS